MNLLIFILPVLFIFGLGHNYDLTENEKTTINLIVKGMIKLQENYLKSHNTIECNPSEIYNAFSDYVIGTQDDISSSNLKNLVNVLYIIGEKVLSEG